jgi:hypothetical protein
MSLFRFYRFLYVHEECGDFEFLAPVTPAAPLGVKVNTEVLLGDPAHRPGFFNGFQRRRIPRTQVVLNGTLGKGPPPRLSIYKEKLNRRAAPAITNRRHFGRV